MNTETPSWSVSQNDSSDPTKNDCMQWCGLMWKANNSNAWRSSTDMDRDCNNLCNAAQGMQNNDVRSCEKSEWILRDTCYSDIAKKTKDATICENISEKLFLNTCYTTVAEETKDFTLCDKISDQMFKDICLENSKK